MLQLEVQSEWDVGGGRLKVAEVNRENFFFFECVPHRDCR